MINISQEEFLKKAQDSECTILDVRMPSECAEGIVSGALMIDFLNAPLFQSEIKKLDQSKTYLIYCRSGNRSGQACTMMDAMGFENTYNLVGGMMAWKGSLKI